MDNIKPNFLANLRIIHRAKQINRRIKALSKAPNKQYRKAADLSKEICNEQFDAVLAQTPGEVLKQYKTGARIQPIANYSLKLLSQMSVGQIAGIEGVGPKSADAIKRCVDVYTADARQQHRIHIDPESRTQNTSRLVRELYRVDKLNEISEEGNRLKESALEKNKQLIKNSRAAAHPLLWAVSRSKETAQNSISELQEMLDSPLVAEIDFLREKRSEALKASHDEYWKAFCEDTERYHAVLDNAASMQKKRGSKGVKPTYLEALPEEIRTRVEAVSVNTYGLKCVLRVYQKSGVQFILSQRDVLLGDEMGLGKTIEAIATIVSLRNSGATHFVVVCPASVLINWKREIEKHSDLTSYILHGNGLQYNLDKWQARGGVAIVNFENAGRFEYSGTIAVTVVDEAHYIKNIRTLRTQSTISILRQSERRLFLSGTPIENNLNEMVALISLLQPDIATQICRLQQPIRADVYKHIIAPVYYRRTKEAVWTEMPKLQIIEDVVELSTEERTKYIECIQQRTMSAFTKMRQISFEVDNPAASSKLNRIRELCEEAIANGRKVLIFSFYLDTINKIKDSMEGNLYGPITGSISPQARQGIIDEFTKHAGGAVLLSQILAGGTGLNIQAASIIILCEPQYKPSIENQAIARAYRIGQKSNVSVYRLLCSKTVDERILQIVKEKQALFDAYADKSISGEASLQVNEAEVAQAEFDNSLIATDGSTG